MAKRRSRVGSNYTNSQLMTPLQEAWVDFEMERRAATPVDPGYMSAIEEAWLDDRRKFHPEGKRRSYRSPIVVTPSRGRRLPSTVAFEDPVTAIVCARRRMRREVLFALKLRRKRGRGGRARHTFHSLVRC